MAAASTRQRGQAIVEFAFTMPLLVLLILGAFDVSILASNKGVAVSAVRHGARLGAELGGTPPPLPAGAACQGALDPAIATVAVIDNAITYDVLAATFEKKDSVGRHLSGMYSVTVNYIDIYLVPSGATDGSYQSSDETNRYIVDTKVLGDGTTTWTLTPAVQTFPLSDRCQGPLGQERDIGVHINWTYSPVNHIPASTVGPIDDYAVEKENLCNNNCVAPQPAP